MDTAEENAAVDAVVDAAPEAAFDAATDAAFDADDNAEGDGADDDVVDVGDDDVRTGVNGVFAAAGVDVGAVVNAASCGNDALRSFLIRTSTSAATIADCPLVVADCALVVADRALVVAECALVVADASLASCRADPAVVVDNIELTCARIISLKLIFLSAFLFFSFSLSAFLFFSIWNK